jgi:hypothetical protein
MIFGNPIYVISSLKLGRPMVLPLTQQDFMAVIARETARMSYPGSMSRGAKPVVRAGTKGRAGALLRGTVPNLRGLVLFERIGVVL